MSAIALEDVAAHAREAFPLECCGLLVSSAGQILEAVRSPNVAADPARRFLVDPKTHIDALRHARIRGLSIAGFYHSHPESEPEPSSTDLEGAAYPDHLYLIVRPLPTGCQARLWRLEGSGFQEIPLEIFF
jgi:proteasome lid subunit RPN8/RPN11